MLNVSSEHVPVSWILTPDYVGWPRKIRNTVSWMLGQMLSYIMQGRRILTQEDYLEFLKRARWKAYNGRKDMSTYGEQLEVMF
jgi:hypothetical protein